MWVGGFLHSAALDFAAATHKATKLLLLIDYLKEVFCSADVSCSGGVIVVFASMVFEYLMLLLLTRW